MKKSSSFPLEPWLQVARCATSIDEELHKVQAIIQCQQSFETRSTIGGLRELSKIWHLYSMLHFWFLLVRMIYDIYSMFLERCAGKILRNLVCRENPHSIMPMCVDFRHLIKGWFCNMKQDVPRTLAQRFNGNPSKCGTAVQQLVAKGRVT